jgi:hypothetical protein
MFVSSIIVLNKRSKMSATQRVYFISLLPQCVSTSKGHIQDSGIKYIKGSIYSCNCFKIDMSVLQIC